MNSIEISEIFYSLEGEGPETGHPTVYVRMARCNKKCPLWNNTKEGIKSSGYADLGFDPKEFKSLSELPEISKGCDSQYAVNPEFSHMWETLTASQMLQRCLDLLPGHSWSHPSTKQPVILSLTGGEPTLRLKFIVDQLINDPLAQGIKVILFETNASVPLPVKYLDVLYKWANETGCQIIWSNSPKLPNSGETWSKSIIPSIVRGQVKDTHGAQVKQYLKFVVDLNSNDFNDVQKAVDEYVAAGVDPSIPVYLMPEACTTAQQQLIARDLADFCRDNGYRFSIRLQNVLWGNAIGT